MTVRKPLASVLQMATAVHGFIATAWHDRYNKIPELSEAEVLCKLGAEGSADIAGHDAPTMPLEIA